MSDDERRGFVTKITNLMYVSFILWFIVIGLQLIIGIITAVMGYGVMTLILMVHNILANIRYYKNIQIIKNYSSKEDMVYLVEYFENSIKAGWIFTVLNLVLGGLIGVVGSVYDLILAYYVKGKKGILLAEFPETIISEETY